MSQLPIHRCVFRIHGPCQCARKTNGSRRCQIHPDRAASVSLSRIGNETKILPVPAVSRSDINDQMLSQLRLRIGCHRLRLPVLCIRDGKVRDVDGLIRAFRNNIDDNIARSNVDCPVRCLHAVHRVGDGLSRCIHITVVIRIQIHHTNAVRVLRIRKRCRKCRKLSQQVLRLLQVLHLFLVIFSNVSREDLRFFALLSIVLLCSSRIRTRSGKAVHISS